MSLLKTLTTSRPAAPVPVSTQHIPYVETLWNQLVEARERATKQEEYVRTASQLGVKVDAIERVANTAALGGREVAIAGKTLDRIKRVLAAGCEPTTPPEQWFCGMLTMPKRVTRTDPQLGDTFKGYPDETWPSQNLDRYRSPFRQLTVRVFSGAMPIEAVQKLATVKGDLDDVRVYSPSYEDFDQLRNPVVRDPVLIGRIDFLGEPHYFEIARWDIDADLAALFRR